METRNMFVKSKFGIDPEAGEAVPEEGKPEAAEIEAPCREAAVPPVSGPAEPPVSGSAAPRPRTAAEMKEIISLKISDIDLYIGKKEAVVAELRSLIGQPSGDEKPKKRPSNYDDIAARIGSISDSINAKLAVRDELEKLKGML